MRVVQTIFYFYLPLNISSNNTVTISLIHSYYPLSLWKDDNLCLFFK